MRLFKSIIQHPTIIYQKPLTTKLIPSSADLYLWYICPKCGSKIQQTSGEVIKIGRAQCYCGTILEFEPISEFRISPQYGKINKTSTTTVSPAHSFNTDNIICGLTQLGYKKSLAKSIVDKFLHTSYNGPMDEKTIMTEIVKCL